MISAAAQYLLENDKELLAFDEDDDEAMSETAEDAEPAQTEITHEMLKQLSKALVQVGHEYSHQTRLIAFLYEQQHRSLKALRTLLLAFRAATTGDELKQGQEAAPFVVHSPTGSFFSSYHPGDLEVDCRTVFNKLVLTTLKYTPMVFKQHIPVKELPSGKL